MRRLLASLPKKDRLKAGQGTTLRGMWRHIVSILNGVTVSRASARTVTGYASDATIADGQSLLTVPVNVGAYPGQRLSGSTWYTTDANGVPLGNPVVVDVADAATNLFQGYNKTNLSLTNWLTSGVGASLSIVTTEGTQAFYRLTAPVGNAVFAYHNIGGTADTSTHSIGAAIKGGTGATSIGSAAGKAAFAASSAFRTVENNGVTPAGVGGKIVIHADAGQTVDFYLNTLVNASTVGPLIITNGSTALRAADQASTPTPPLLSISEGAQRIGFTPHQAGQVDKTIVAFYVDATHKMELTINATQVLASYTDGANTDSAAFTYSHVASTAAYADWYWDSAANEIGVRAAHKSGNIDGETFATATFAGLTSLPATQQLGHENGAAVLSGTIGELDIFYASKSDAGW